MRDQEIIPLVADMLYGNGRDAWWAAERCEVKMRGGRKAVRGCGWIGVSAFLVSNVALEKMNYLNTVDLPTVSSSSSSSVSKSDILSSRVDSSCAHVTDFVAAVFWDWHIGASEEDIVRKLLLIN